MATLLNTICNKLVYVDNDIYFFSSPQFIFNHLNEFDVLLTPHYYSFDTDVNQILFEANLWCGLYNAGFIAASSKGVPALNWWAKCCLYNVKKAAWRGLFDDQKYLDMMPIVFNNIHVLKHKGCNVAGWNLENCTRILTNNNQVVIAPDFPIVFIHFTPAFFQNIFYKRDVLLQAHHDKYVSHLQKLNPSFTARSQFKTLDGLFIFFSQGIVFGN